VLLLDFDETKNGRRKNGKKVLNPTEMVQAARVKQVDITR
jgi:hypothetical protein